MTSPITLRAAPTTTRAFLIGQVGEVTPLK